MATIDLQLSDAWVKIADATQGFKITIHGDTPVALCYQDVDSAPSTDTVGHVMNADDYGAQGYQRLDTAPPGYVFARCARAVDTTTVGLTVWTI